MATQISNYINDLKRYNRRDNTLRFAFFTLTKAEEDIGKNLLEINNGDIEEWIFSLGVSPNTQLEYLSRMEGYYQWAIRKEFIIKNPIADLHKLIKNNPVKKHPALSPQQVRQLILSVGDIRRITILLVAYKTGLRKTELFNLTLDDIEMDNNKINIKERKGGKNGCYVFFDDECKNYLQAYLKIRKPKDSHERKLWLDDYGRRYQNPTAMTYPAIAAAKACGFKGVTLHSFRHFFTSHLNANRCHPKVIQILRADSNRNMVEYYTEFSEEQVKDEYMKCVSNLNLPRLNV